jgi:hypothetical protein
VQAAFDHHRKQCKDRDPDNHVTPLETKPGFGLAIQPDGQRGNQQRRDGETDQRQGTYH